MAFLEQLMSLLNGPQGPAIFHGLRLGLLVLLALAALALLAARGPKPGPASFALLKWLTILALLAVLVNQAYWQLAGFSRPAFVQFMRRYNPRPDAAETQVRRGTIRDANGVALASSTGTDLWQRDYPLGPAAAHVVGYFHPRYGLAGVERVADPLLGGYGTVTRRELDRFGRNLLDHRAAVGSDLMLTIDARLQRKAAELIEGCSGAVVMLRPGDGAILALVSAPGFDPREPGVALADILNKPMLNRAVQGLYPAGSTFKILVAALASEQSRAPRFTCPGTGFAASPGARPIRDSEATVAERTGGYWGGWGRIGLRDGFIHSSNVYFAQLGLLCGAEALNTIAEAAHLNERIVYLDGPTESLGTQSGHLPHVAASERRAVAQLSIGQGELLVTPLHVALFTGAIAAEGEWWQPRLRADEAPRRLNRIVSRQAARTVRDLMRDAVTSGTGRGADLPGLAVCGKTGTAEAPGGDDHAWFTCFAPAAQPAMVVTVLIERGGYGARAALPVARALLEEADRLGLLKPKPAPAAMPAVVAPTTKPKATPPPAKKKKP
jgi:peptidoglycan glycosyltransferase